jgi:hypothetical protein
MLKRAPAGNRSVLAISLDVRRLADEPRRILIQIMVSRDGHFGKARL